MSLGPPVHDLRGQPVRHAPSITDVFPHTRQYTQMSSGSPGGMPPLGLTTIASRAQARDILCPRLAEMQERCAEASDLQSGRSYHHSPFVVAPVVAPYTLVHPKRLPTQARIDQLRRCRRMLRQWMSDCRIFSSSGLSPVASALSCSNWCTAAAEFPDWPSQCARWRRSDSVQ